MAGVPANSSQFREFLRKQFEARRARNPAYSLRAFAKQLAVDHSTLSQILRGRRPLTDKQVSRLGERLGLGPELIAPFLTTAPKKPKDKKALSLETFEVLSQWQHAAILELTHVKDFQPDSRWIARTLGLTVHEVNVAIVRLIQLGLLELKSRTSWVDHSERLALSHDALTEVALQKIHRETHELALRSMEQTSPTRRAQTSFTVAVNTKRLPQVLERIEKFRRSLEAFVRDDDQPDDVYRIEISVFPLTPEGVPCRTP